MTQNLNSTTFQPFVLYTAAAGIYVVAAFVIDFLFRAIEKSLTTPPDGRVSPAVTRRRRRRRIAGASSNVSKRFRDWT